MKKAISQLVFLMLINVQLTAQSMTLNDTAVYCLPASVTYPFSFAILSDVHTTTVINPHFSSLMSQIANLNPKPVFVINKGDLTNSGYNSEYKQYYDSIKLWMDTTSIAIFSLPGNHDLESSNFGNIYYKNYIGDSTYYFDWGNTRIICTDNVNCYTYDDYDSYNVSNEELASVGGWLSDSNAPPIIFSFTHVPFHDDYWDNFASYRQYFDTLVTYGAKANFCGHRHYYKRNYSCDGVFDIVSARVAQSRLITNSPPISMQDTVHFLLVTISEDETIKIQMYHEDDGNCSYAQLFDFYIDRALKNLTITNENSEIYTALGDLWVAGDGDTFVVESGGEVILQAIDEIELNPGFEVELGGEFSTEHITLNCVE